MDQLDPASPREFAQWYRLDHGGASITPETLWTEVYGPREAAPIARIVAECEKLGVEVEPACTLASFAALAGRKAVVILAAHWRSGLLQRNDLLHAGKFLTRLATARTGVLRVVRERVIERGEAGLIRAAAHAQGDEEIIAALLDVLQSILRTSSLASPDRIFREAKVDSYYQTARNRALLDTECAGELAPGVGLELFDGTYTPARVAEAIGGNFRGFMDLAVCNSYILAETIKRANPDCLILANRETTSPLARLLLAHQTLRMIARKPGSYVQTVLELRDRLRSRGGYS